MNGLSIKLNESYNNLINEFLQNKINDFNDDNGQLVYNPIQKSTIFLNLILSDLDNFKYVINYVTDNLEYVTELKNNSKLNKYAKMFYFYAKEDYVKFFYELRYNMSTEVSDFIVNNIDFEDFLESNNTFLNFNLMNSYYQNGEKRAIFFMDHNTYPEGLSFEEFKSIKKYHIKEIDFEYFTLKGNFNDLVKYLFNDNFLYFYREMLFEYKRDINLILYNKDVIKYMQDNITEHFKEVYMLYKNNYSCFDLKTKILFEQALKLQKLSGKTNFIEKNPSLDTEFMLYIVPNFTEKECMELLKYETGATKNIIDAIKKGDLEIIRFAINYCKKYNIFTDSRNLLQYIFRDYDKCEELFKDLHNSKYELKELDIINLKNILLKGNNLGIKNHLELMHYDQIIKMLNHYSKTNEIVEVAGFSRYKELHNAYTNPFKDSFTDVDKIALLFGFSSRHLLNKFYTGFGLNDYSNLANIYKKLVDKNIDVQKLLLTKKEFEIIEIFKMLNDVTLDTNLHTIEEIINNFVNKNNHSDFTNDVENLKEKIRKLYNLLLKVELTNTDSLKGKTEIMDGVEVLEVDEYQKFNFLVHKLHTFDTSMGDIENRLTTDPSLWTKLEGSSTISTSSISENNLNVLERNKSGGIYYIFDDIPQDFLLFMCHEDLYTNHGINQLEPYAREWNFSDLETINQRTLLLNREYNEVSGYREGMMPKAIICFDDVITRDMLNHAKYFGIKIIKINPTLFETYKQQKYVDIRFNLEQRITPELIHDYLYSGVVIDKEYGDDCEFKINYLIENISNQIENDYFNNQEILKLICSFRNEVIRLYSFDENVLKKNLEKIDNLMKMYKNYNNSLKAILFS